MPWISALRSWGCVWSSIGCASTAVSSRSMTSSSLSNFVVLCRLSLGDSSSGGGSLIFYRLSFVPGQFRACSSSSTWLEVPAASGSGDKSSAESSMMEVSWGSAVCKLATDYVSLSGSLMERTDRSAAVWAADLHLFPSCCMGAKARRYNSLSRAVCLSQSRSCFRRTVVWWHSLFV
jgi:hypothetical protein